MTNLRVLDVGNNTMTGNIPTSVGSLGSIEYLFLDRNQFDGAIPGAIGSATTVMKLDLSRNQLSGDIPTAFLSLTGLETSTKTDPHVSFDYNMLDVSDAGVETWLLDNAYSWKSTQTIPPTDIAVSGFSDTTVSLAVDSDHLYGGRWLLSDRCFDDTGRTLHTQCHNSR